MRYNFNQAKINFKKIEDWLIREYSQIHAGRATISVIDSLSVLSYGTQMPLKNLASISIENPKTLRVEPWDKNQIKEIEKAILVSNLGLSVINDGSSLRVIFPQLTEETRKNMVKVIKEKLEEARISVRKERESILEDIENQKKEALMSEDEFFYSKDELQKIVNEVNKNLEDIFKKKEQEILTL